MANNSPTIVAASLDDEKLKASIEQMVQNLNAGLEKMKTSTDAAVGYMQKSLQQLGNTKIDTGGSSDGGASRRAKAQNEETESLQKTNAARREYKATLDQTAQATQSAAAAGNKYSDEIIKQANAIRAMKEWQEKGRTIVGERVYYDPEKSTLPAKKRLSLEEQILNTQKEQELEIIRQAAAERQEVAEKAAAEQEARRQLAVETQITQEQSKRSQPKNFTSYDSLRESIAHVLGLQQSQVKLADTETASYNNLDKTLKQLNQTYNKLTNAERNSEQGKALVASIHEVERAMQKIRSQATRPISLESIIGINGKGGLSVKTLDDMAYKLRQLQAYKQGIDLTKPNADAEIKKVDSAIKQLKTDMDKYMSTGREVNNMNNALARSFNYMKNRLAFYFTVGASTAFVKNLINIRGQYELLERSIGILFDSMQTGTKIFSELNAMAIKSPFTTMELGAAAKQLSAYNIAAKDVVDTTRRLADIAAAVGVPIERLTYALGQIKSYGYLNSRDARMFANAGIPLIQNLADMYTKLEGRLVSIGDVYDRIKHKQVSFEDTLKVVNEMTDEGGRFFNFQEKAADTLVVRLANLTLAWNNMMNELGKDNTGIINGMLGGLKTLFEHWRDIDAAIWGVVKILGVVKTAQFIWLMYVRKTGIELALANTFGQKLGYTLLGIGVSMKTLAVNPMTWIAAAVVSLGYLYQKWRDLQEANDNFNKSIADGAKENIESIDKFFGKYRKEIESIGSAQSTDQEKMWERIRDEIEKTTKNAQQYIDVLEKIPDAAERVGKASLFLEQQQTIQQEARRMAEHGMFDMGGGFANDSLAKDLQEYEKTMNSVLKKYNSLEEAQKDFNDSMIAWSEGHYAVKYYNEAIEEAEKELDNFTSILDNANLARVMGNGSDEERLANIRSFAQLIRDNFLATEEGQKISAEGQARLNKEIDYWIAQQGVSNGLIKGQRAEVEANRSAWEAFFTYLNADQKKALDYLVSTGQTYTDEFKKIWNEAADEMKKSSLTAYEQIQSHIADLRKTAPIVIDVIYRETKESKDEAQKDFEKRFTTPKGRGVLSAEAYTKEEKRLNTIYGRFNKKAEEDMVEWEKRLGQEYQDNEKKLASYNKMLEGYNKLTDEQKKKREAQINTVTKERDALQATQNALKEIQSYENFDFEQFKKGKKSGGSKKDFLGEAFAKVVEITTNMQKRFKEYKQAGVDANTALEMSTQEYAKTLEGANTTLAKYGIRNTKTGLELAKMELRDLRAYYESLLAIASGVGNTKGVEALEKAIASLNVEITKIDYKKITDGLNNELSKLKDDYELAVELDANPELGDMFASMFGIDTDALPKTFGEAFDRANEIAKSKLRELKVDIDDFDLMSTNIKADADNKWMGVDIDSEPLKEILKWQKTFRDMFKSNLVDTEKMLDEYVKKYGDYSDKIAEIERDRLERIRKLNEAYFTEQMRQSPEYQAKLNAINKGASAEKQKAEFDEFKDSRYYTALFENLDYVSTKTIRDMRDRLRELMDTMHDLTPEQLKQIMAQYEKLEQKLVKRSPFKTLAKDFKSYVKQTKERKAANEAFRNADKEYRSQQKVIASLKEKYEQAKANENTSKSYLDFLKIEIDEENEILEILKKQLDAAQEKADKYNMTAKLARSEMLAVAQVVSDNMKGLAELRDNLNNLFGVDASKGETLLGHSIDGLIDGLAKAGDGISKVTSSAQSGNVFGVASGVVDIFTGIGDGIASLFGDGSARTKRINREINKSVETVRQLNMAYKELERTVSDAMGAEELRARRAEIANKKEELSELQRQMQLEQSKRSKDRDDDAIKQYQERIQDLQHDIQDLTTDITTTLLGGDIKSAAESFVSTWVDAWRQGEDVMSGLRTSFDDMIDTMISKSIASRLVANRLQKIWDVVDEITSEKSEGGAEVTMSELMRIKSLIGDKSISEAINEDLTRLYEALGIAYGSGADKEKSLSALQQGIQGITEDTAGALEAITNGISQQSYLQSDLLTQIRDTILGFDLDIQMGVLSEILLQLQSSYQIQMSIRDTLQGWSNASGMAVRVEMV